MLPTFKVQDLLCPHEVQFFLKFFLLLRGKVFSQMNFLYYFNAALVWRECKPGYLEMATVYRMSHAVRTRCF